MKIKLFFLSLLLGTGLNIQAQDQAGTDIAFLNVGLGARPMGMGNAYTAVANDSNAAFYNAAGMLYGKTVELQTMQAKLGSGMDLYYLSGLHQNWEEGSTRSVPDSAFGFFWVNGSIGDIPLVSESGVVDLNQDIIPEGFTSYEANALGLSYAGWLKRNLAYGLNVTGFSKNFDKVAQGKGYGITVSPSLLWMLDHDLAFGMIVKDLINYQKWETGAKEVVLPELRMGLSTTPWDGLLLSAELRQKTDVRYKMTFHTGIEKTLLDLIRLRAGFSEDRMTAGVGLYSEYISIHYSYVGDITEGIGDSYRLSLSLALK